MGNQNESALGLRELVVGLVSGAIVAAGSLLGQSVIDDQRTDREDRRENLRFVRGYSSNSSQAGPFRNLDLTDAQLSGLRLAKADFGQAILTNAKFWDTDLSDARFTSGVASGADFWGANLKGTYFIGTDLVGTRFKTANLTSAVFFIDSGGGAGADFGGALLDDAKFMEGSNMDGVVFTDGGSQPVVCYNSGTKWPPNYSPPPSDDALCDELRKKYKPDE